MSVRKILGTATALSLLCFASAQAETLQVAVGGALANHPAIEGAAYGVEASQQDVKAQASGYYPKINANAAAGRIFGNNSTSRGLSVTRGEGYSWLGEGSVTARQMIFDGMETQARVGSAKADTKAAEMNLADARETLCLRMVTTYISLLRARAGLEMLQGQEESVKSYLSRIEGMVEQGGADEAELQQARDVQAILDNYTADYEGQVRSLEADYAELTGHMPESALVAPALHPDAIPDQIQQALEIAKASHPTLKSALYQEQSAGQQVRAEKGALYPDLAGELSYAVIDKRDLIGGESEDGKAVVRLNWDLETGGGQLARIKERKFEQKQARAHAMELERNVERGVKQSYSELATARAQFENQQRRVDLNVKLLDTYKSQFEAAKISLLQLMQSDNQLLITKLELLNIQNRVLMAQYNILAAMGQLQSELNVNLAQAETK